MKKHSLKQTLAIFLALATIISTTAGCSNPKPSSEQDKVAVGGAEETKVHKLKLLGPDSENTNIKFADKDKSLAWQELDKIFKAKNLEVELETIAGDQYAVTIQTRVAAGQNLPDFCNITALDIATKLSLADSGTILPINKIIDEHSEGSAKAFFEKQGAFARKSTTASDGNRYWIPSMQETTYEGKPASTCQMIAIRKDWLDKVKMPVPTNAEEFVATIKAFQDKDVNGNGLKDEIYATETNEFGSGISNWFGLPSIRISVDLKSGKIISPWTSPGAKDYFKFMNRLIKEGLLDETLVGAKGSVINQMVAENKVGAIFTYALQTWLEPTITGAKDPVYMPIGPIPAVDGITPISSIEPRQLAWDSWAFTKNCTDLVGAGKLIDVIASEEFATLSAWGVEGKTFEKKDGVNKFLIKQSDWAANAQTGNYPGEQLWGKSLFPRVRFVPMEAEIDTVEEVKRDYQKKVIFYDPAIPSDVNAYLAVPTAEEQQTLNEIERDFKTFSKELATDLVLGNRSVNDWDKHMKELNDVGFEKVLNIYQARFDRFNKA